MRDAKGSRRGPWTRLRASVDGRLKKWTPRLERLEELCLLSASVVQEFPLPAAVYQSGSLATGSDGNIWYTEDLSHDVGVFNVSSHTVTQIALPGGVLPEEITTGPDGNLWFTAAPNTIGVINATTHAVSEFTTPSAASYPRGITAGPDGNVWFTESRAGQIGVINPATHAIGELATPTSAGAPGEITTGPDGNLWFTDQTGLGQLNPSTAAIRNVALTSGTPTGLASGPDGNVWFVNGTTFGKVDPTTLAVSQYTAQAQDGSSVHPGRLILAPDANLWFTDPFGKVGSFNPTTHAAVTYLTAAGGQPSGLVVGSDRNAWFIEPNLNEIGRVSLNQVPGGTTTVLTSSAAVFPVGQPIALSAVVSGLGPAFSGGVVVFVVDGQAQPAAVLSSLGNGKAVATLTLPGLAAGSHVAAAVFTGDSHDSPSVSTPVAISVAAPSTSDGPRVVQFLAFKDGGNPLTLLLIFNEALNPTAALNPHNYRLTSPGGRSIGILKVKYHSGSQSVVLLPAKKFNVNQGYQLTVVGTGPSGLSDPSGRLLDGAGTGQAGSNYSATIGPGVVVTPTSSPVKRRSGA